MKRILLCIAVLIALCSGALTAGAAPIHDAAAKGDLAKVKALLRAAPALVSLADKDGATPLHHAVAGDHKAVVGFLLASNADVNARKTNGVTPLHVAAALAMQEIAKVLLSNGADPNAADSEGRTPLSLAEANGRKVVVELLAGSRAGTDDPSKNGLPLNDGKPGVKVGDEAKNKVIFDNQSGEQALVKLVGPKSSKVEIPKSAKRAADVLPGRYTITMRYGLPGKYHYAKGQDFEVKESATTGAQTTITLRRVVAGSREAHAITKKEFETPKPNPARASAGPVPASSPASGKGTQGATPKTGVPTVLNSVDDILKLCQPEAKDDDVIASLDRAEMAVDLVTGDDIHRLVTAGLSERVRNDIMRRLLGDVAYARKVLAKYIPMAKGNFWEYRVEVLGRHMIPFACVTDICPPPCSVRSKSYSEGADPVIRYAIQDITTNEGLTRCGLSVSGDVLRHFPYEGTRADCKMIAELESFQDTFAWEMREVERPKTEQGDVFKDVQVMERIDEAKSSPLPPPQSRQFRSEMEFFRSPIMTFVSTSVEAVGGALKQTVNYSRAGAAVETPAGVFKNCVMKEHIFEVGGEKWKVFSLFAPCVGMVKKYQVAPDGSTAYTMVLTSYQASQSKVATSAVNATVREIEKGDSLPLTAPKQTAQTPQAVPAVKHDLLLRVIAVPLGECDYAPTVRFSVPAGAINPAEGEENMLICAFVKGMGTKVWFEFTLTAQGATSWTPIASTGDFTRVLDTTGRSYFYAPDDRATGMFTGDGDPVCLLFHLPKGLTEKLSLDFRTDTMEVERVTAKAWVEIRKRLLAEPNRGETGSAKPESSSPLPVFTQGLDGSNEVRIRNPNDFSVKAGLRSGDKGKDLAVPANGVSSAYVPDGKYDIYFVYSNQPDALYKGDSFSLSSNGVEIQIVKVVNGNYDIRRVN